MKIKGNLNHQVLKMILINKQKVSFKIENQTKDNNQNLVLENIQIVSIKTIEIILKF